MDPPVTAATVGVGGTVIVAMTAFISTARATRRTIDAARDSRLWDQRAAVYVDTLAALHYRRARREYEIRTSPLDDLSDQNTRAYLARYREPDWYDLEGRLLAFASREVVEVMRLSSATHMMTVLAYQIWQKAACH